MNSTIKEKINEQTKKMEKNDVYNKPSCCFFCSCPYQTTTIHLPKHILNDSYYVYGMFCSLECASAYLFDEDISINVKFDRFQLLHSLYNVKKIKPAPKPFFLLDKFCGNLTIDEYRLLHCSLDDNTICFTDKPIICVSKDINKINTNNLLSSCPDNNISNVKNVFNLLLGNSSNLE